ncbi:MAG: SRPBCC family protein [Solirubrobacteraceae bacterium]|nr:SRPBCC family protein [Solirubrobacteraceae bacterium]
MASSGTATVTLPTDTEILIAREFDAPKHLVYKAYTTPELVRRWWTSGRGEMTTCEIDLRVGGAWRYVMLAHGEFEVAFHGEFREIVENERLVTTEVYEMPDAPPPAPEDEPLNIVTLTESGGRTTLEIVVKTTSKELRDLIVGSGMEEGMQDGMDLLEQIAIEMARDGA